MGLWLCSEDIVLPPKSHSAEAMDFHQGKRPLLSLLRGASSE